MKKRMKYLSALVLLCLLTGGCGADRALVFDAEELSRQTQEEAWSAPEESRPASEEVPDRAETEAEVIYVHVCGAVRDPGVVALPAGSRGEDAVLEAGGFGENAAEAAVNLAERLEDGMQLYIPTKEEAENSRNPEDSGLVDINRADAALLCTLPGIGEARADAIIAYRESNGAFQSPEDIMQVPGIKESAYEKLKDKITVR